MGDGRDERSAKSVQLVLSLNLLKEYLAHFFNITAKGCDFILSFNFNRIMKKPSLHKLYLLLQAKQLRRLAMYEKQDNKQKNRKKQYQIHHHGTIILMMLQING
ncbi:hypothetical protein D3C75_934270 [compost metagenome]